MEEGAANYRGYVLVAPATDLGARCWAWKEKTSTTSSVAEVEVCDAGQFEDLVFAAG